MHGTRILPACGLLILLASLPAVAVTVESPKEGELLLGPTRFAFDVSAEGSRVDRIDVFVAGRLIGTAVAPEWAFEWDAPADLSQGKVYCVVHGKRGLLQTRTVQTRVTGMIERVDVAVVQLHPLVVDRRGKPIRGLAREDFTVIDQGRSVSIQSFSDRVGQSNVGLLLDTSRSMEPKLAVVQEACNRFMDRIGSKHMLSLFAFNHSLHPVVEQVRDPQRIKEGLRGLDAGGGTALYDALLQVLQGWDDTRGRQAIVVFSDGRDERSLATRETALDAARASDAIIFTIGTLTDQTTSKPREDLRALARETGGQSFFIESAYNLNEVFDAIVEDLESRYALSYPLPPGPDGLRSVEVRVRGGHRVRCRTQYAAGR